MSYWDAYLLPVRIRKHMIDSYLKFSQPKTEPQGRTGMQALAEKGVPNQVLPKPQFLDTPQRKG
jgi:hypothetical protein